MAAVGLTLLCASLSGLLIGCEEPPSTLRPSPSLLELQFTPQASSAPFTSPTSPPVAATPQPWPLGWDVAFCTAFADTTVAHELVIDIERALDDKARDDAAGLANELGQTAPLAAAELGRVGEWQPATDALNDLNGLVELYAQAADSYKSYFAGDGGKSALRDARKARRQVSKAVSRTNTHLQVLADEGLACPGMNLSLETF